ncbi:cell division protein FtsZ [Natrinema saccharevitans]|uniref:Cell division protein FtsZ n=1 Tax=Natrinema saccharevitans TaxID=301967 RepID=A0A1S8B0M1_9EURY|nr:cell division protein FtsZ [Natrinema saccharevitans]OLZ42573.1 cell division protein FtsZ [Natrinema saccharevitans]
MTYLFVGAGQAGGAIVDSVFDYTDDSLLGLFDSADISTVGRPLVFNSTMRDLQNLSNVPPEDQYGIAEQHGLVQGTEAGFEEMVTGGFGRNPVDADEVMAEHAPQIQTILGEKFEAGSAGSFEDAFDDQAEDAFDESLEDEEALEDGGTETEGAPPEPDSAQETDPTGTGTVQFAFLCLGLGGGTGCGIGPHLAREIKAFTDGRAKVVAIAVLPNTRGSADEDGAADGDSPSPGRQAWNARYGLDRLEEEVDGIVLVDNQRISYLDSAGGEFGEYNDYVAASVYDMVAGPVLSGVDPSAVDGIDTPDIDVRDIVTSLSFGVAGEESTPGYAAIGRSVTMTKSLPGYLLPFVGKRDIDSAALSRLSAAKQTLAKADVEDAQKAISLIRAPKSNLEAGGNSVEIGTVKEYLERSCGLNEVNIGVAMSDRNLASVTTLLTYRREDIDRLADIEAAAEAYEDETEELLA